MARECHRHTENDTCPEKSQMSNFRKQIRAIRLDNWFSLCPTGPPIRGAHNQRQISHMGFGKSGKKRKENGGGGNWEGCFWESTPAILLCACAPLGISVPKLLASLFLFFYFLLFTFSEMPKCQNAKSKSFLSPNFWLWKCGISHPFILGAYGFDLFLLLFMFRYRYDMFHFLLMGNFIRKNKQGLSLRAS